MKLSEIRSEGCDVQAWADKGYELPKFHLEAVRQKTHDEPTWIHFGAGNIFRAFPAALLQRVLDAGAYDRGVIVAEGFEAGGHNGREETTTLCLIPAVRAVSSLPLIAAGGIATGEAILAMRALGADGVQVGTRFALTEESSASEVFKEYCLHLKEGDTRLLLKKLSPVRLARGNFQQAVAAAEAAGATEEDLRILLSRGRAKRGIFEGDLEEGELEIGQASALLNEKGIQTVAEVMDELATGYQRACETLAANVCERWDV